MTPKTPYFNSAKIAFITNLFICLLLSCPSGLFAENAQVTVSISKVSGYIGEPFEINLILKSPTVIDSIKADIKSPNFDVISKKDVVGENNPAYQLFEQKIKIIFWKTGRFKIDPIKVETIKDKIIQETLETNSLEVTILSSLEKDQKKESNLRPLKPLAKVVGTILYFITYLGIFLVAVAILFLAYRYIRNKFRQKTDTGTVSITAIEEFTNRIKSLDNKQLIEGGKIKLHFLELTEITKSFLHRQYQFNAEDLTTFETLLYLRRKEQEIPVIEKLDFILSFSDRVKFAKFVPQTAEYDNLNGEIRSLSDIFRERQRELERIEQENAKENH